MMKKVERVSFFEKSILCKSFTNLLNSKTCLELWQHAALGLRSKFESGGNQHFGQNYIRKDPGVGGIELIAHHNIFSSYLIARPELSCQNYFSFIRLLGQSLVDGQSPI